ncbi:hypothetical protein GGR52DRAFT_348305 [Hypoxylon sp. FL1284]|nr:hypothetical protein GGR52DRAFT_348305 [Hypoxylon sp. FL1284]
MSPDVAIYTSPPEALVDLLRTHHLPHALPLLRRLRFAQNFPGGITEHTRILFAASDGDTAIRAGTPFAAAYLDFSRGPETEIWLYSSLERQPDALASASAGGGTATDGGGRTREEEEEEAARCARRVLAETRRQRDAYSAERRALPTVLAGSLSETLRLALLNQGVAFADVGVFDKWMFRLDALPPVRDGPGPLAADMRWDTVRRGDIPLILSRTHIQRKERTIVLLPSMAVYRDDGRPIAWALLGPDSSLSSLHCEEEWRKQGFAKAVAMKLWRERLKDYDDEVYCWADVAPDNPGSQRLCKSLGGRVAWSVSWSQIDLDRSFPDQQ